MSNDTNNMKPMDLADALFSGMQAEEAPYELFKKPTHTLVQLNAAFPGSVADLVKAVAGAKVVIAQINTMTGAKGDAEAKALETLRDGVVGGGGTFRVFPAQGAPASLAANGSSDYRSALNDLGLVPFGNVVPDVVEVFKTSLMSSLGAQLKSTIQFGRVINPEEGLGTEDIYSGAVDFEGGSISGSAVVSVSPETLRKLMSKMIGQEQEEMNELVVGGVGEFINIVAGVARGELNRQGYPIKITCLPQVVSPEFQAMRAMDTPGAKSVQSFGSPDGELFMELTFFQ